MGTPGCAFGGLAQLARALAWHARGHRFEPDILHFWTRFSVVLEIFDMLDKQDCRFTNEFFNNTAESMSFPPGFSAVAWREESRKGRMADALAHGGDEGRDKLR